MRQRDLGLEPQVATVMGDGTGPVATHVALPFTGVPRFLFPRSSSRAVETALHSYTQSSSTLARSLVPVIVTAARVGALRLVPGQISLGGENTFLGFLAELMDAEPVASIHLGPPRANRKPVFHLIDPRNGASLAYAKLGINGLTCQRVRTESSALERLAGVQTGCLRTPELISAGVWEGLDYLVMRPLGSDSTGPAPVSLRLRASADLVDAFPTLACSVRESTWWSQVKTSLDLETLTGDEAQRLRSAATRLLEIHGSSNLTFGAVHGDWSAWNMCTEGDDLVVWDWERFSTEAPVGWDEIHYRVGSHAAGRAHALAAELDRLAGLRARARATQELILATYLLHQGVTHLVDGQREAGARAGDLGTWLLPALEQLMRSGSCGEHSS